MKNTITLLQTIIWPLVVLILGFSFLFVLSVYLIDANEIEATTNSANCQIALKAENDQQKPQICKDIFDAAKRQLFE